MKECVEMAGVCMIGSDGVGEGWGICGHSPGVCFISCCNICHVAIPEQ